MASLTTPIKTSKINTNNKSYRLKESSIASSQSEIRKCQHLKEPSIDLSGKPQLPSQPQNPKQHSPQKDHKVLFQQIQLQQLLQYCQYCHNAIANIAENTITNYNPANWLQNKGHGVELAKTDSVKNNGKKIGKSEVTNPSSRTTTLAVAMIKSISTYLVVLFFIHIS